MTGDTSHLEGYLDADHYRGWVYVVDTWLANQLFSNIPSNSKILIVETVTSCLLLVPDKSCWPAPDTSDLQTRLERTYRQSEESTIVTWRVRFDKASCQLTYPEKGRPFLLWNASGHIHNIEKILGAAPQKWDSVRYLKRTPMYRGTVGIDAINQLMQDLLNLSKRQVNFEATQCHYRTGTSVIHLVNVTL